MVSMNPAGFSSEARAKKTSAQYCEHMGVHKHHILFSQAFPFPLLLLKKQNKQHAKTKPTPTATPRLKQHSHTVQTPCFRHCLQALGGIYQILTNSKPERDSGSEFRTHPAPVTQRKSCPTASPSSSSQRKLPQHRSPGPILWHN